MTEVSRLTRLLPLACLAAAICLFASELMTTFEFTPPGGEALDSQGGADRHGNALAVIAVFAIGALALAVFTASKPAATAVAVAGVVALLVFLLVDLPDANAVGHARRRAPVLLRRRGGAAGRLLARDARRAGARGDRDRARDADPRAARRAAPAEARAARRAADRRRRARAGFRAGRPQESKPEAPSAASPAAARDRRRSGGLRGAYQR